MLVAILLKLVSSAIGYLGKRSDNNLELQKINVGGDVAINIEELKARVELARLNHESREEDRKHWFTAWMVPVAFIVFFSHVAAIVFDSMPLFGHTIGSWKIPPLPGIYADMEYNAVLGIIGVGVLGVTKKIFSK